jgi:uncharacterized protein YjbI with pentapeptide repeats
MKRRIATLAAALITGAAVLVGAPTATALQPTAKKKCDYIEIGSGSSIIETAGGSKSRDDLQSAETNKKCRKNFSGRDLSYADISGNLKRANFSNANLNYAQFRPNTNAQGAKFSGASMKGANLSGNFNRAQFSGIVADEFFGIESVGESGTQARFRFSDWSNTTVGMNYMYGADFTGANFSGSTLRMKNQIPGTQSTFANANFTGATIYPDALVAPNADFTGSTISVSFGSLSQADLRGANFTNTTWVTTDSFGKARGDIPWDLQALDTTGATWVNVTCPDGSVRNAPCWE